MVIVNFPAGKANTKLKYFGGKRRGFGDDGGGDFTWIGRMDRMKGIKGDLGGAWFFLAWGDRIVFR